MPVKRVSTRRVREILRMKFEYGSSDRAIAVAVSVPRSTVQLCLSRFAAAGLSWPLPATLSEQGLEALLFALPAGPREGNSVVGTHALSVGTYSSSNDSTPPTAPSTSAMRNGRIRKQPRSP